MCKVSMWVLSVWMFVKHLPVYVVYLWVSSICVLCLYVWHLCLLSVVSVWVWYLCECGIYMSVVSVWMWYLCECVDFVCVVLYMYVLSVCFLFTYCMCVLLVCAYQFVCLETVYVCILFIVLKPPNFQDLRPNLQLYKNFHATFWASILFIANNESILYMTDE